MHAIVPTAFVGALCGVIAAFVDIRDPASFGSGVARLMSIAFGYGFLMSMLVQTRRMDLARIVGVVGLLAFAAYAAIVVMYIWQLG